MLLQIYGNPKALRQCAVSIICATFMVMKSKTTSIKIGFWSILGFKAFLLFGYYGLRHAGMSFVILVPIAIFAMVGVKYTLSSRLK
jgi:hypothetical protein